MSISGLTRVNGTELRNLDNGIYGDCSIEQWFMYLENGFFEARYNRLSRLQPVLKDLTITDAMPTIFVGRDEDETHSGRNGG